MKSFFIIFFLVGALSNISDAQDKGILAQDAYTKAEEYFALEDYNKALSQLDAAEQYLGKTNSKILYLKVNVLKAQFAKNSNHYQGLKSTINQFFKITDKSIYPEEKYIEIVRLQSEIEEFVKSDSVISNKLLSQTDLNGIKHYLSIRPNTFYSSKLNIKLAELQKYEDKIAQKQDIDTRLAELEGEISRAKQKDYSRRFWGGLGVLLGGGIGGAALLTKRSDSEAETVLRPVLGVVGVAGFTFGIISLVSGNNGQIKSLKNERNELLSRKQTLSWQFNPYYKVMSDHNIIGLRLQLSF